MKKTIFILLAMLSLFVVQAQKPMQATASIGTSVSQDQLTGVAELGATDSRNTFAVIAELSKNDVWYAGLKYYRRVYSIGRNSNLSVFGSAKINLDNTANLIFDPGVALSVALGERFWLRTSISSPIGEQSIPFQPINLSAGVALTCSFK
jgi:hypothetical protein